MCHLDDQALATVLAALRFYQERGQSEPSNRSAAIHEIATGGDALISLDNAGIDALCERLNVSAPEAAMSACCNAVIYFDAWADSNEDCVTTFDHNICSECERENPARAVAEDAEG